MASKVIVLVTVGLVLILIGMSVYLAMPSIQRSQIKKMMVLKEGTFAFKMWKDSPQTREFHVYLFNLTEHSFFNVTDLLVVLFNLTHLFDLTELTDDQSELLTNLTHQMEFFFNKSKTKVEEVGPYVFRESVRKTDISWNENNTIQYKKVTSWNFEPSLSIGSLDDVITTWNVPAFIFTSIVKKKKSSLEDLNRLRDVLKGLNTQWFVQKKVRELLFDGYEDELTQHLSESKNFEGFPFERFGWFYKVNQTKDKEFYSIFSGWDKYGELYSWNQSTTVEFYDYPCNRIYGSAGDFWPPFKRDATKVSMFIPDICRSMNFTYLEETTVGGLESRRYYADKIQLDNGELREENKCFCNAGSCLPTGATDVSRSSDNIPIAISYPHFLYADSAYLSSMRGLQADPEKHMTYLDIQTETGIPLTISIKFQKSIIAELPDFELESGFSRRAYYPVLWYNETSSMVESSELNGVLKTIPLVLKIVSFLMIGIGVVLLIVGLIFVFLFPDKNNAYIENHYSAKEPKQRHFGLGQITLEDSSRRRASLVYER